MIEDAAADAPNIARAFLRWGARRGWNAPLFSDFGAPPLSYQKTYRAAFALGEILARRAGDDSRIGVMLPSSAGAAVVFYAALLRGLTPAMLNPAAGKRNLIAACETANIRAVYTSQKLLDNSDAARTAAAALRREGIEAVCLESLRPQIGAKAKLRAAAAAAMPSFSGARLPGAAAAADDVAAVLFTSGSEGRPKGVALSHKNLLANAAQVLSRLGDLRGETMLNSLPVFHSFGLLAGVVLPAAGGAFAVQYPSPLHYRKIPEVIRRTRATVFFSADSFLAAYAREANPEDMRGLRRVFAGAEKLRESTRREWADKFGADILEGYGVTEASPVIAVNTPGENRRGAVGRPLAGMETRIAKREGVSRGGALFVRGPNVMRGYLDSRAPGGISPPPDGWHDTGDIAEMDDDGFLRIQGRARRFVKIAGEMTPLDGVEEAMQNAFPRARFAAVRIADDNRGEQIAALCDDPQIVRAKIAAAFQASGLPPLWIPRLIIAVPEIPQLPTGKTDYPAAQEIAESRRPEKSGDE
ncbi:MAG: AMP-binding protein [Gammaproteobacteria bacterium]